ncbi:MAG: LUD domain-containing protein [Bacteroidia bacterium]|nr:LUD domain-containing protein [Bacteroidia bacterium]
MQDSTSREKMLKKIRQALINKTPPRFPGLDVERNIYGVPDESPEEQFAQAFSAVGGKFIFCESELEFLEHLIELTPEYEWKNFYCWEKKITDLMDKAEFPYTTEDYDLPEGMVGITTCEALVARLGSVVVSSRQGSGRRLFPVPTSHLVMAYTSQLVPEMKDALLLIKNKYPDQIPSMIASLTGPSRTADIEKTLVSPAHGPRDIFVFLIDDSASH